MIAEPTEARDGVKILAFAVMDNVAQISMRGDGALLGACGDRFCQIVWSKAAMTQRKCVQCEVVVTALDAAGKQMARVKTEVIRP